MAKTKTTTKKKAATSAKKATELSKNKATAKKSAPKKVTITKKAAPKAKKTTSKAKTAPKKEVVSKAKEVDTTTFPKNEFIPTAPPVETFSAISDESRNAFRRLALSKAWKREGLVRNAIETFGKDNVEVKEFNNKQIAFYVGGVRVPSEGYFSVN